MKKTVTQADWDRMKATFEPKAEPPPPACPDCKDTGWKDGVEEAHGCDPIHGVTRCGCQIRKIAAERAKNAIESLDKMFHDADLYKFEEKNDWQGRAHAIVVSEPLESYLFTGPNDRGKTYLMAAQFRACMEAGVECHFRTARQLVDELRKHETTDGYISDVWDKADAHPEYHLFIDDIDKVNFERTGFRQEILFELINKIYARLNGITFTSNMSLHDLAKNGIISISVGRRLDERCTIVEF